MSVQPVRDTSLIEIKVCSLDSNEAAKLANAIAQAYRDYRLKQAAAGLPKIPVVEIMDKAVPGLKPVRPNKPLNISLGMLLGGIASGLLGTTIFLLRRRAYRRQAGSGAGPEFGPGCRPVLHGVVAAFVGMFIGYQIPFWSLFHLPSLFYIFLALVIGASISAYIELAKPKPVLQPPTPTPDQGTRAP